MKIKFNQKAKEQPDYWKYPDEVMADRLWDVTKVEINGHWYPVEYIQEHEQKNEKKKS